MLIMQPNPKFVDGVWVRREGEMEVSLYIPSNRRRKFEESIGRHAKRLGVADSVKFLPSYCPPPKARL